MNKQIALFKAHVSFRVSNSYFRDKKAWQQFVANVNSIIFVILLMIQ